jgi:hypothetical protein
VSLSSSPNESSFRSLLFQRFLKLIDLHPFHLPAPHVVDRLVDDDLFQPGAKRRLLPELVEIRERVHKGLLQSVLRLTQMVQYPHANVEHGLGVTLVQLILSFTLAEFTTLHQFDVPVGVNLCFQAEGLDFERSEVKTADHAKYVLHHVIKIFSKKMSIRTKSYRTIVVKKGRYIFEYWY